MPNIQDSTTPWWADPKGASVMDPLYISLARKFGGLVGAGDMGSAAMGMAGGPLEGPSGLVQRLMGLPKPPQAAEATGALLGHLNSFKALKPSKQQLAQIFSKDIIGGPTPPPLRFGSILSRTLNRVPEARGMVRAGEGTPHIVRPEGFDAIYAREAAGRAASRPGIEQDLEKTLINRIDTPRITSPEDLALVNQTSAVPQAPTKPLLGIPKSSLTGMQQSLLKRSGLSEDDIRIIRQLGPAEAMKAYPNINKTSVQEIAKKLAYNWVKD